ncbi:hypothetical protein [Butyrivibrio sp. INlla14]|uniref:hypothetical protein n=1 Tax=Butyrivibrio sp. INlla14 TaxID=1520808 RepID=UPI000876938C|nr:hypothetical protein [Butyrivibrio sp. INlla14]SCY76735.1 hypothetical protein SAMN02910371_03794 [Butyrivibrio sp. INlla14]
MSNQMTAPNDERYCSIEESIKESFEEIRLMREGKKKKNTLEDLWAEMAEWKKDE